MAEYKAMNELRAELEADIERVGYYLVKGLLNDVVYRV